MMHYTNFQMFDVISYIPDDRYTHQKESEFDVFNLLVQLLQTSAFQYFLDLLFLLLLFSQLHFLLALHLPLHFPHFNTLSHSSPYLLIAVVDHLNQEITWLVDSSSMEHEHFKHITNNILMIDGSIQFNRIHALDISLFQLDQHLWFPDIGHDQVVNQHLEFVLSHAFFKDELIVFHECVDVQLHI